MTARAGEQGFSLVEVLVALSIAAVLSALLFGGYSFASKSWLRAQVFEDGSSETYAAQTFLRRAFSGMTLRPDETSFSGSASVVTFSTMLAMPGEQPAPTLVSLGIDTCPDGTCLIVALGRDWQEAGKQAPSVRTPLVRGIESITLAYRDGDGGWSSTWPSGNLAPSLVRIDLQFAGKMHRTWPALYLVPATTR